MKVKLFDFKKHHVMEIKRIVFTAAFVVVAVGGALGLTAKPAVTGGFYCKVASGGDCNSTTATRSKEDTGGTLKYCAAYNSGSGGTCETTQRRVIDSAN